MRIPINIAALAIIFFAYFTASAQAKLKLLNVVFRHGDRAPDDNGIETYPKDPYANRSFYPMGLGGLTNEGKLREYQLGEFLREQYGDFLGDVYAPSEVSTRSTDTDRTKMSLQLVLAGLYPPKDIQQWNEKLDWQPIPMHTVAKLDDVLMVPEECPKYLRARQEVERLPEVIAKLDAFKPLMANLTKETGKSFSSSNDMYFLYHALMAQKSLGLKLPSWSNDIFPDGRLLDGINLEYEIFSYNDEMKRLNGGMLLRKFIENMEAAASKGSSKPENRKLFLYSGHETNVAAVLQVMGVYWPPHAPAYTSAVIVELHEENYQHFVKVKYYKGIPKNGEEMVQEVFIPGCYIRSVNYCTLNLFKMNLRRVIPSKEDTQCDKRGLRTMLGRDNSIPYGIWKPIMDKIKEDDELRHTLH